MADQSDPLDSNADLNPDTKWSNTGGIPTTQNRHCSTAKQVQSLALAWEDANKQRVLRAAAIQADYDGAPPIPKQQLVNRAEAWKANLNYGFLSGLVDSAVSRMTAPLTAARFLTYASLPDVFPDHLTKTQTLRTIFTEAVRSWDGFANFSTQLAKEVDLHGYAAVAFLDPIGWRPEFYKSTDILVANESSQISVEHAVIHVRKDWLPYELVEKIRDAKTAGESGWNVEGCVDALNSARVKSVTDTGTVNASRTYEEWVRDGNFYDSQTAGNKVVATWITFVKEYDGSVTQWIVSRDPSNTKELFYAESRFKSMAEAVLFFTLESGNGTLHGTKGVGRILGPQSTLMNRTWNKLMDQLAMSTAKILKTDPKNARPVLQVNGSFVYIDKEVEVESSGFAADVTGPMAVLQTLVQSAQQRAGAFISGQIDHRTDKTAREVSIDFQREQENTVAYQIRFEQQMAALFTTMQQRIFSDGAIKEAQRNIKIAAETPVEYDDDGLPIVFEPKSSIVDPVCLAAAFKALQAGISVQEIKAWRKVSAARVANKEESNSAQGLAGFLQLAQNPQFAQFVNWRGVFETSAAQLVGPDLAKDFILPSVEVGGKLEAQRQQLLENVAILGGVQVPVLPTDYHQFHMEVILGAVDKLLDQYVAKPNRDTLNDAAGLMEHYGLHLEAATKSTPPLGLPMVPEEVKRFADIAVQINKTIADTVMRSEAQAVRNEEVMRQVQQPVDPAMAIPVGMLPEDRSLTEVQQVEQAQLEPGAAQL